MRFEARRFQFDSKNPNQLSEQVALWSRRHQPKREHGFVFSPRAVYPFHNW